MIFVSDQEEFRTLRYQRSKLDEQQLRIRLGIHRGGWERVVRIRDSVEGLGRELDAALDRVIGRLLE